MSSCLVNPSIDVCIQAGIKQHQLVLTCTAKLKLCKQQSDLGGAGAIEGVGLQDVSAGLQKLGVDVGDDVRAGDDQQVVVAPQLMRVLLVAITPEVLLSQPEASR